jgi:hypothetical protein
MKFILLLIYLFAILTVGTATAQSNPLPLVSQPLVPMTVAPGGLSFTLTLNGANFVSGAVVKWNDSELATEFVNASRLTATVPAADITSAGTVSITVQNPTPGGGTSNRVTFAVSMATGLSFTASGWAEGVTQPFGLLAEDFNGDGKLDLLYTTFVPVGEYDFYMLLGNGDGTFLPKIHLGNGFPSVAVGDFNGDGILDLATLGQEQPASPPFATFGISLGNGDGTFSQAGNLRNISNSGGDPVVGDFNRDGKLDVALSDDGTGIHVLLGNGDGTFQSDMPSSAPSLDGLWGPGDFNGDGKLDLIATFNSGTKVGLLSGNGDGSFQGPTDFYTVPADTQKLVAVDVNGDGKLDVIAEQPLDHTFAVLIGNGDGTFRPGALNATGSLGLMGDFNGDGKFDLTVFNGTGSFLIAGNGDGTFQSPVAIPTASVAGDFNNDGKLDLVVAPVDAPFQVWLQDAPQGFSFGDGTSSASVSPGQTATYTLVLSGSGGFSHPISLSCSGAPAGTACSVTPTSVTPSGTSPTMVTVTVVTAAPSRGIGIFETPSSAVFACLTLLGTLGTPLCVSLRGRRQCRAQILGVFAMACLLGFTLITTACGGGGSHLGSNSGGGGVKSGTYTLTVTATSMVDSTTLTSDIKLTLVVQ